MRIGMVVDNDISGDNRVLNEAKILADNGHDVFVLGLSFGHSLSNEKIGSVQIQRVKVLRLFKNIRFILINRTKNHQRFWTKHINSFVLKNKVDVLHAHDLYMVESCLAVSKKLNLKVVADLHENYPEAIMNYDWTKSWWRKFLSKPHFWKKLEPLLLGKCDAVITLSPVHKDILLKKYPFLSSIKVFCYENVPDLEVFESCMDEIDHSSSNDIFRILYFGLISKRRGIETVVKAIKLIKEVHNITNIQLLLCGNIVKSEEKFFLEMFSSFKNKDLLDYKGWVNLSELPEIAKTCNVGVSPIYSNKQHDIGVANKVYQYMACGLPILASNSKMQASLVLTTKTGLIFNSEDYQDLMNQLLVLYKSENLRKEFGLNGVRAISDEYNVKVKGRALLELYDTIF